MKANDVPEALANTPCGEFSETKPVAGPALSERRVAIVSTAGLMHKGDRPFSLSSVDYRILDMESDQDIMMSHVSTNFDRSGFVQDHNLVLPLDRLQEKAANGEIASVARFHYSFMGAIEPQKLQSAAEQLATNLRGDEVNGLILTPV